MKNRGISSEGVVIVRPDRYVAYRSIDSVADAADELNRVFDAILASPQSAAQSGSAAQNTSAARSGAAAAPNQAAAASERATDAPERATIESDRAVV